MNPVIRIDQLPTRILWLHSAIAQYKCISVIRLKRRHLLAPVEFDNEIFQLTQDLGIAEQQNEPNLS